MEMRNALTLFAVLQVVGMLLWLSPDTEAGETGAGLQTFGNATPMDLLTHTSAAKYYGMKERAAKKGWLAGKREGAERRHQKVLKEWYRYFEGVGNLIAGQGGMVSGIQSSLKQYEDAVCALSDEARKTVSEGYADAEEYGASRLTERSCRACPEAARAMKQWVSEWRSLQYNCR